MKHGLLQIRENRQIWLAKVTPPLQHPTHNDSTGSSLSTTESAATTTQSEGTTPTPRTRSGATSIPGEVRKIASSSDLPDKSRGRDVRKERSFSGLAFWRKRVAQKFKNAD
jgi:hypothetical protein